MPHSAYLRTYAEVETSLAGELTGTWQYVLCIPAFKESPVLLERLAQMQTTQRVLLVLLLNAPATASPQDLVQTQELLLKAQGLALLNELTMGASLHTLSAGMDVLVLDRCSSVGQLLPPGQGVGMARKILGDLACALIEQGNIQFPWIFCSDADVVLPEAYFLSARHQASNADAALIYPFHHQPHPDPKVLAAQALYDFTLHYYVAGLTFAGSPYAFQSIGSTIAIAAHSYAKVRGFPRREAAEDFYMLNKLAKVGKVRSLDNPLIEIDSRYSDRVPFGTGAAIGKITSLENPLADYRYYHPAVFLWLKTWLDALPAYFQRQTAQLSEGDFSGHDAVDIPALISLLQSMQVEVALAHALQHGKQQAGFNKHMHDWFDGFRTLRFLHQVRDGWRPSLPLEHKELDLMLPDFANPGLLAQRRSTLELFRQEYPC